MSNSSEFMDKKCNFAPVCVVHLACKIVQWDFFEYFQPLWSWHTWMNLWCQFPSRIFDLFWEASWVCAVSLWSNFLAPLALLLSQLFGLPSDVLFSPKLGYDSEFPENRSTFSPPWLRKKNRLIDASPEKYAEVTLCVILLFVSDKLKFDERKISLKINNIIM